jgi:YwiC-like protein
MPTTLDLTEEQKVWVDDITHVLTTARLPLKPSLSDVPTVTSESGTRTRVISVQQTEDFNRLEKARRERQHALIVPREHGAWGLLFVPMVTGAGVALRESTNLFPFVLLVTAALTLFWLRTPLESLLKISAIRAETREERQSVLFAVFYLGSVSALALAMLLWDGHNPLLWKLGAAAAIFFAAQEALKLMWLRPAGMAKLIWRRAPHPTSEGRAERTRSKHSTQQLRMLSELIGTVGLTAAAPASYYVITGHFGTIAWILWIANLIFAGNQIHYVQLRLHTVRIVGLRAKLAHGWVFAAGQAVMTLALAFACVTGLLPRFASLAFAPILFRGWFYFIQKPAPLVVRKLGWSELAQAIVFCAALIGSFTFVK